MQTPHFSELPEETSLGLLALEWQRQLTDPHYLAFLRGLYRLALAEDEESGGLITTESWLS